MTESVTHRRCDARPTVIFPASGHHRPLTGTKLYCLVTEAHVCEQLAQGRYLAVPQPRVEPATSRLQVRHHQARHCKYARTLFNKLLDSTVQNIGFVM